MEGFKSPRWTLIEDVRMAKMLDRGMSNEEIYKLLFKDTDRNLRGIQRRSRMHCKATKCVRCGDFLNRGAPQKGERGVYLRRGGACETCRGQRYEEALRLASEQERKTVWDEDQDSFIRFHKAQRRKRLRRLLEPRR
jgi:ferredoxin